MGHNETPTKGKTVARDRIKLEVYVDLDPTPGTFHSRESARNVVANILNDRIPHYNPIVSITNYQK